MVCSEFGDGVGSHDSRTPSSPRSTLTVPCPFHDEGCCLPSFPGRGGGKRRQSKRRQQRSPSAALKVSQPTDIDASSRPPSIPGRVRARNPSWIAASPGINFWDLVASWPVLQIHISTDTGLPHRAPPISSTSSRERAPIGIRVLGNHQSKRIALVESATCAQRSGYESPNQVSH